MPTQQLLRLHYSPVSRGYGQPHGHWGVAQQPLQLTPAAQLTSCVAHCKQPGRQQSRATHRTAGYGGQAGHNGTRSTHSKLVLMGELGRTYDAALRVHRAGKALRNSKEACDWRRHLLDCLCSINVGLQVKVMLLMWLCWLHPQWGAYVLLCTTDNAPTAHLPPHMTACRLMKSSHNS